MDGPQLLKPALYAQGDDGVAWLNGGACACGHVFFPLQDFGCEMCGGFGVDLTPQRLKGLGRIVASATVHLHAGKGREAPFDVGVVKLDDGPVVRTLLTSVGDAPAPGQAVRAVLVEVDGKEPGQRVRDLRFEVQA
ncbi:MAG: OB-fold domain-containing protein [Alphaproteobacteria bacterium]|nr:OB-fold domain-containing protein [Alphaproteobacteria bacterium]MBU1515350.1 OB-fold domain-containing protein [Alphaproteobacteria bacterium]MBU2095400.1 OB-fold domain-containing protein [Alphaproteobacteria bacterium]MBU2152580.1 OB-fold domain-containing protein [Alphaproteobacteria bacterium]MBU2309976.1 OB-fold domain-containing protein [Alphaproteobacteria bacterium]